MVVCELRFVCQQDLSLEQAQLVITELLDELRYNGQVMGREFALTLTNEEFVCHLVCPEPDSMSDRYFTADIQEILTEMAQMGITGPMTTVKGLESQSDFTDNCESPKGYILYSTFVQSCSPIRCSEHFMPVPLYKLPEIVRKPLIKWQESQAACDQLQMNEMTDIENAVVAQLSDVNSQLMQQGQELMSQIEQLSGQKGYVYLYRVGGTSFADETLRKCPNCDSEWKVEPEPLFDLFDFKCDQCQLLSNISWNYQ